MKKIIIPILIITISIILVISFKSLEKNKRELSSTKDITENIKIDNTDLTIKYHLGNMLDEEIAYGNKVAKIISIENNTENDVSFALALSEVILSDETLRYNVLYSYDSEIYTKLNEGISLTKDDNLAYNLVVEKHSNISLKIEFCGNNQIAPTKITGKLSIKSNLSEKDIYIKDILEIQSELENRINALNGINERGYFIFNLSSLPHELSTKFKGYILIDASDYSDLKYTYYVHNDKYMLNNYALNKNDISKKSILDNDENIINGFNSGNICASATKKGCREFSEITFNPDGGKENFYKSTMEVINIVKNISLKEKYVYIFDVVNDITNNTKIRGYVLVNNTGETPEYYLYLTNDLYMVTGYNLTKLGDFSPLSNTIRSYTDTAFNLSSENMSTVCSFSGFSECYKQTGEKV